MVDSLARARSRRGAPSDGVVPQPNAVLEELPAITNALPSPSKTVTSDRGDVDMTLHRWADVVPSTRTSNVALPALRTTRRFSNRLRAAARVTQVHPLASSRRPTEWTRPSIAFRKNVRASRPTKSFRIVDTSATRSWCHRYYSEVWLHAAQTLAILLGNSFACIACAWCAALFFSRGNVFSGKPAAHQSDFEFLAGAVVSSHLVYYWLFTVAHTPALMPLEFVVLRERNRPTTFLFCLQRLARHTFSAYVGSLALLVSYLAVFHTAPLALQHLQMHFYVSALSSHLYNTSLSIALRRIFREESTIGLSRQRLSSFKHRSTMRTVVFFCRTWMRMTPMLIAVMFAGLYVHLTSGYQVAGDWDFLVYTLGSLAFKIMIKEIAKLGIVRLKVQDPRTVFLVVGLPTVLVDTQVRIMLQRVQNTKYTLLWTVGMAALEIVMRLGKVLWTKRRLQRRGSRVSSNVVTQVAVAARGTNRGGAAATVAKKFGSLHDDTRNIQWKIHTVAFQIAEVYANMTAEYIAIGCSTCVLYFYSSHPKYDLRGYSNNSSSSSGSVLRIQGVNIVLQLGVEIVVDYISCVIEIGEGIDFHEIRRYRVYLGFLFVCIASVNIHICAMVYMDIR